MMSDHASFSCFQFPSNWKQPKYKLGIEALHAGQQGTIIGCSYESVQSNELGWWYWISCPQPQGWSDVWAVHEDELSFLPVSNQTVGDGVDAGVDTDVVKGCDASYVTQHPTPDVIQCQHLSSTTCWWI